MNLRNQLSPVLACLVSTLVAAWLLGSLVTYVVDELGPAGQDVLMLTTAPWFGARPLERVRRIEPVNVIGHPEARPEMTAAAKAGS
jgi:hypothetical protein